VPISLSELKPVRTLLFGFLLALGVLVFAGSANAERPGWYANPSLAGPARVGATLEGNVGGLKCEPDCLGTAYEWLSCTGPGNAGADRPTGGLPFDGQPAPGCEVRVAFPGSLTYVVRPEDANRHIQLHIVAENNDCGDRRNDGSQECRRSQGHAYTNTVGPIAAAAPAAPAAPPQPAAVVPLFTAMPSISGQPVLGQTLTASNGTVTGTQPITFRYQWFRCSSALRGCQAIEGATQATYRIVEADLGARITVTVTATNAGGGRAATARLTARVRAAGTEPSTAPGTAAGVVRVQDLAPSERLTVDSVTAPRSVRPGGTAVLRVRVEDRRGFLVQGALVDVLGKPGEVRAAAARRTGARGVAVLRIRIDAATNAQSIVLAVIASKPQDTDPGVKVVTLRVQR
jgi:hypothetical protein